LLLPKFSPEGAAPPPVVRSVFISVSRARARTTLLLPNRAAVAFFLSVRKGSAPPLFGCSISWCGFPFPRR
jgi:hypothetical protein